MLEPVLAMAGRAPWQEVIADASIVLARSLMESDSPGRAGALLAAAAGIADKYGLARSSWEAHALLARRESDAARRDSHAAAARQYCQHQPTQNQADNLSATAP